MGKFWSVLVFHLEQGQIAKFIEGDDFDLFVSFPLQLVVFLLENSTEICVSPSVT